MKIKFHPGFKDRTFINGENVLLFVRLFPFPRKSNCFRRALSRLSGLCAPAHSQLGSDPEAVGFNVGKLQEKRLPSLVGWFLFYEFVFENLKQTNKRARRIFPKGQR